MLKTNLQPAIYLAESVFLRLKLKILRPHNLIRQSVSKNDREERDYAQTRW